MNDSAVIVKSKTPIVREQRQCPDRGVKRIDANRSTMDESSPIVADYASLILDRILGITIEYSPFADVFSMGLDV